jgi:chemotaxis protein MotA
MDIATVIGLVVALAMMALSIVMSGGAFSAFWDTSSILMVFGGTLGAVLVCFPLKTVLRTPKTIAKAFFNKPEDPSALIAQMSSLAETARREGMLALEHRLEGIKNPFVRLGIQMAVDGTRPEVIEDILRTEIDALAMRHREGKAVIDQIGRFGPAFGMIGTLLGLIMMLGNMSDPTKIGGGMAVALITTLYGALLANVSFLPLSEKLAYLSKQELLAREITIRGIMAIQSGENPRVVEQKLITFLPPQQRPGARKAA